MGENETADSVAAGTTRIVVKIEEGTLDGAKRFVTQKLEEITSSSHTGGTGTFTYESKQYDRLRAKIIHRDMERTLVIGPEPDSRFAPAFPTEVLSGSDGRPNPDALFNEMVALLSEVVP